MTVADVIRLARFDILIVSMRVTILDIAFCVVVKVEIFVFNGLSYFCCLEELFDLACSILGVDIMCPFWMLDLFDAVCYIS